MTRGKSTAKKVGAGAGIGALIGALAGGGKGAAIGATVGAGAGTGVSAATKGQQIILHPEAIIAFQKRERRYGGLNETAAAANSHSHAGSNFHAVSQSHTK